MTSLLDRIREIVATPTGASHHTLQRRIRWMHVARAAVEAGPGDLVEIGAMVGDSTVPFCEIAEQYGRRVLVVDPWTPKTQNCRGPEYGVFMERTEPWRERGVLEVLRKRSQDAEAVVTLRTRTWAFALVDGLHKYNPALCDILAVRYARVICVDDLNMEQVRRAFDQALVELPEREGVQVSTRAKKREGYLV